MSSSESQPSQGVSALIHNTLLRLLSQQWWRVTTHRSWPPDYPNQWEAEWSPCRVEGARVSLHPPPPSPAKELGWPDRRLHELVCSVGMRKCFEILCTVMCFLEEVLLHLTRLYWVCALHSSRQCSTLSPWAKAQNFTCRYHSRGQNLIMIFENVYVCRWYLGMIAIPEW